VVFKPNARNGSLGGETMTGKEKALGTAYQGLKENCSNREHFTEKPGDSQPLFLTIKEQSAKLLKKYGLDAEPLPDHSEFESLFAGKDVYLFNENPLILDILTELLNPVVSTLKVISLQNGHKTVAELITDLAETKKLSESAIRLKIADMIETAGKQIKEPGEDVEPARPAFSFCHISEIEIKPPEWLIKDLIEKDSLSVFFGDPGCGKSFLGIDLACCVTSGKDFHGKKVKQGAVFYIAGEGHNGLRRRFKAWEIRNQVDLSEYPIFVSRTSAQLTDEKNAQAVADAMAKTAPKDFAPSLVFFDTLARNFGNGHENDTADMNKYIRGMDIIRERFGCAISSIHHCGLADKSRGRGASPLKGALDAEYKLFKDVDEIVRLESTKIKEFEEPAPMAFYIRSVELGLTDEDGNQVTSAILDPTDYCPTKTKAKPLGRNQVTALEVLNQLYNDQKKNLEKGGYDPENARVTIDDWQAKCQQAGVDRKRFYDCKNTLSKAGTIKIDHGYCYLV
jgi:hypothetical protein